MNIRYIVKVQIKDLKLKTCKRWKIFIKKRMKFMKKFPDTAKTLI